MKLSVPYHALLGDLSDVPPDYIRDVAHMKRFLERWTMDPLHGGTRPGPGRTDRARAGRHRAVQGLHGRLLVLRRGRAEVRAHLAVHPGPRHPVAGVPRSARRGLRAVGQARVPLLGHRPAGQPDYERFLADFHDVLGECPQTTTAQGQKDIERTRALLRLASSMGSAVDRFSVIALNSLNRIHDGFTPEELLRVECVPQNKEAAQAGRYLKSNAGRARKFAHKRAGELVTEQQSSTIACVSGFLVNMVDSSVRLISPCNASERWPLGYWVLASGEFGSAGELRDLLRSMIDEHVRDGLSVLDLVRLRRDVRMVVEPDRLQVISPGLGLAFDGQPMAGELAALLADGTHTVEQVALRRRSTARVAPIQTLAVLDRLFAQGFFDEEPPATAEGPEMLPLAVTGRVSR